MVKYTRIKIWMIDEFWLVCHDEKPMCKRSIVIMIAIENLWVRMTLIIWCYAVDPEVACWMSLKIFEGQTNCLLIRILLAI